MENAPTIIMFWFWITVLLVLMIVLFITAIILIKKGKEQSDKKTCLFGKMCLTLALICSFPIIIVAGYVLYIFVF